MWDSSGYCTWRSFESVWEREYDLDLVATAPSVAYRVVMPNGELKEIKSPQDLPEPTDRSGITEPYVKAMILTPTEYVGTDHGVGHHS